MRLKIWRVVRDRIDEYKSGMGSVGESVDRVGLGRIGGSSHQNGS